MRTYNETRDLHAPVAVFFTYIYFHLDHKRIANYDVLSVHPKREKNDIYHITTQNQGRWNGTWMQYPRSKQISEGERAISHGKSKTETQRGRWKE